MDGWQTRSSKALSRKRFSDEIKCTTLGLIQIFYRWQTTKEKTPSGSNIVRVDHRLQPAKDGIYARGDRKATFAAAVEDRYGEALQSCGGREL